MRDSEWCWSRCGKKQELQITSPNKKKQQVLAFLVARACQGTGSSQGREIRNQQATISLGMLSAGMGTVIHTGSIRINVARGCIICIGASEAQGFAIQVRLSSSRHCLFVVWLHSLSTPLPTGETRAPVWRRDFRRF